MQNQKTLALLLPAFLALPQSVFSHGFVDSIIVNGKSFPGGNPSNVFQNPPPAVAGWTANNIDNGFVLPNDGVDVICHKNATAGQAYVTAAPGDIVGFHWSVWPSSHHGPMLDYIAACPGNDCTKVDKTQLSFVKLDGVGLISGSNTGTWADDQMIANNLTWNLQIPKTLAAGAYVIRHETIGLHQAQQPNGAQLYPQCVNFMITGDGTDVPTGGVTGDKIYPDPADPGLAFNLYTSFTTYPVPGPTPWSAAAPVAQQGPGAAPAPSASAGGSGGASSAPASSPASATSAAPTTMQTVVKTTTTATSTDVETATATETLTCSG